MKLDLWSQKNSGGEVFRSGLERLRPLFAPLVAAAKNRRIDIVTVAGTNGKGEVAMRLGKYLEAADRSYGLWTSPHILSLQERFVRNGKMISRGELERAISQCAHLVDELSFYEFYFYVFCHLFLSDPSKKVEVLILEVGMGGRLDAVNLFDANLAAIVSISLDHCEYLGETCREILGEKLGITRAGQTLLTSLESSYLRDVCRNYSRQHKVAWGDLFEQGVLFEGQNYRERNNLLAQHLFRELVGKMPSPQRDSIELKGRWETMTLGKAKFLFVGAHNLDGIKRMVSSMEALVLAQVLISFSLRSRDEICAMLTALNKLQLSGPISLVYFRHSRGFSPENWARICSEVAKQEQLRGIQRGGDWKEFVAKKRSKEQTILVCGSYYFIGEVQKFILLNRSCARTDSTGPLKDTERFQIDPGGSSPNSLQ